MFSSPITKDNSPLALLLAPIATEAFPHAPAESGRFTPPVVPMVLRSTACAPTGPNNKLSLPSITIPCPLPSSKKTSAVLGILGRSVQLVTPAPSVDKTCPLVPSTVGIS